VVAVVPGIRNTASAPVFSYETDVTGIGTVSVRLDVDDDPRTGPPAQTLVGGVQLRNQNQPPTASFTVIPTSGRHLQLNASMSADPEGQLLQYTWRFDGAVLQDRVTPILDYVAPTTGMHTIDLTVKDPSGGEATATRRVEVLP
jgi:PKD repeat protein